MSKIWTDYPIEALGDEPGKAAPIRQAKLLAFYGGRYVMCMVGGIMQEMKACYLYSRRGRLGEVPRVSKWTLQGLPREVPTAKIDFGDRKVVDCS